MFKINFEAVLSPNRVRLTNCNTGQTIERMAHPPFSSDRKLIADRTAASSLLRDLILELESSSRFLRISVAADILVKHEQSVDYDQEELRQIFADQGFTKIHFN